MMRVVYVLPLVMILLLGVFSILQLEKVGSGGGVDKLPSVLIDRPVPDFDLPPIQGRDQGWGSKDLLGQVTLVNIFGSWCVACQQEHPYLVTIKSRDLVKIYGIDWREKTPEAGPAWLKRYGDPYHRVGDDPKSHAAIAFGVTGAPESFIVDKKGVIRHKHTGPITPEVWAKELWPVIQQLKKEKVE
ncbi:MAG: DsbE family thiol:disulfide interchange protein [Alphaproteobacteria bacterium]|nr:DsbE family thiol:disulfide interchange protein [Alphaproteobacteria bacterium]